MSNPIVYSTAPLNISSNSKKEAIPTTHIKPEEVTLIIQRQTKGRGGKTVSVVNGFIV